MTARDKNDHLSMEYKEAFEVSSLNGVALWLEGVLIILGLLLMALLKVNFGFIKKHSVFFNSLCFWQSYQEIII